MITICSLKLQAAVLLELHSLGLVKLKVRLSINHELLVCKANH
jgi:hypothetical protein